MIPKLHEETWSNLTTTERRNKLLEFERSCQELVADHGIDIETRHIHCNGVYAREITIPAGTALVGEIHLTDQINLVSQGEIIVATEEGVRTIKAPYTFISPAGTKRAGYTVTDTVWTVLHATDLEDQQELRNKFIAPNYECLDKQLENTKCLG